MCNVNYINGNQAYIFLSIVPEEYQGLVLVLALAGFFISMALSIFYLARENKRFTSLNGAGFSMHAPAVKTTPDTIPGRNLAGLFATRSRGLKSKDYRGLQQSLMDAFSTQENVRHLISNVEDLKSRQIIDEKVYAANVREYEAMNKDAISAIDAARAAIKDKISLKEKELASLNESLRKMQEDYTANLISKQSYQGNSRSLVKSIEAIKDEIDSMEKLKSAEGTFDITSIPD
jgi:hypothetical protein